jgi:hypothetical protein
MMPDTVSEAIELLESKVIIRDDIEYAGTVIAEFLYSEGIRKPDITDEHLPAISTCCPIAQWLKKVTGEHVLVGITTIFVFDEDPITNEFPLPREEHPITHSIRDFILYLNYFTRSWQGEKEKEMVKDEGGQGES